MMINGRPRELEIDRGGPFKPAIVTSGKERPTATGAGVSSTAAVAGVVRSVSAQAQAAAARRGALIKGMRQSMPEARVQFKSGPCPFRGGFFRRKEQ
ncbi:MAG: hypothetical protein MUO39_01265 [Steroidobacteraceae bacterium]|nr:hypothetical protein [Steroidobacteraceae bacterium]